jgi:cytochrome c
MQRSTSLFGLLLVLSASPAAHAQDVEAGRKVYQSICNLCHDAAKDKNRVGPSLFGIVGRHTGQVPGYSYSDANKKSAVIWTADVLDTYIANPQTVVPGTKMAYGGLKDDKKRADLIAFLATLK